MKDILFRGKRSDNGEWISGRNIIKFADGSVYMMEQGEQVRFINHETGNVYCMFSNSDSPIFIKIIPETVGQYTGINDINGNKIFEGDIVNCKSRTDRANMFVSFKDGKFVMELCEEFKENIRGHYQIECFDKEVIGNIYDNPELLGVNNG